MAARKAGLAEGYAILTVEANEDVAAYHDRQMAVLRREQRLDWLDARMPEADVLKPLPTGSFCVKALRPAHELQKALAL